MKITSFETWWVSRDHCLFDKKRQGGAEMNWDVIALKIGTDAGIDGIATCLAARSGGVTENYLYDNIAPVIMGRDPHDREAIWQELWNIDRHLTFFPVYLPGPIDVALWDICAKEANLPFRSTLTRLFTIRHSAFRGTRHIRQDRFPSICRYTRQSATQSVTTTS